METTKKQFQEFQEAFKKYQDIFGLHDWKVYFKHEELENDFARIDSCHETCVATVTMSSNLSKQDYYQFDPKEHGKHDAIHLLISRISCLAQSRHVTLEEINCEDERIVRIIHHL